MAPRPGAGGVLAYGLAAGQLRPVRRLGGGAAVPGALVQVLACVHVVPACRCPHAGRDPLRRCPAFGAATRRDVLQRRPPWSGYEVDGRCEWSAGGASRQGAALPSARPAIAREE
jgi:hypothetical protein